MHFCTQHHTVQHSMVLCILYCPAWLLSLMLTHRHQSLQRCQRDNHCRYVVYTACHALSPRAFQSPECVHAKKQSLQVCCTVLIMLCGLQRAAKNKNDTRRRAADMPSSCYQQRCAWYIQKCAHRAGMWLHFTEQPQSRQVETHPTGRRQRRNPRSSPPCAWWAATELDGLHYNLCDAEYVCSISACWKMTWQSKQWHGKANSDMTKQTVRNACYAAVCRHFGCSLRGLTWVLNQKQQMDVHVEAVQKPSPKWKTKTCV